MNLHPVIVVQCGW